MHPELCHILWKVRKKKKTLSVISSTVSSPHLLRGNVWNCFSQNGFPVWFWLISAKERHLRSSGKLRSKRSPYVPGTAVCRIGAFGGGRPWEPPFLVPQAVWVCSHSSQHLGAASWEWLPLELQLRSVGLPPWDLCTSRLPENRHLHLSVAVEISIPCITPPPIRNT